MQIQVVTSARHGATLAELARRRVRFTLRRRAHAIPVATVRLEDVNGPRGGPDKQCRVELRTAGSGTVVSTATATTWRAAMHAALARAARLLARVFERGHDQRRVLQA